MRHVEFPICIIRRIFESKAVVSVHTEDVVRVVADFLWVACLVKRKCHIFDGLACLVHLLDLLEELGLEVEPQCQAGVVVAPLQIKHLQRVVCVAGESVRVSIFDISPLNCSFGISVFEQSVEVSFMNHSSRVFGVFRNTIGVKCTAYQDLTGFEVNSSVEFAVNTAQIQHKNVINENPHIVVAGELKGH